MSWATRIALPIVAIGGLVYIVTWITNSAPPRKIETAAESVKRAPLPLEFFHRTAQTDPSSDYMRYFRSNYEVGEAGKVDFWFKANNDRPVDVSLLSANCTCSGAQIATVPPAALDALISFLGTAMLTPDSVGFAGLGFVPFQNALEFNPLVKEGSLPIALPAAVADVPQFGIVRVTWNGQPSEQAKTLVATLQTRLPDRNPETVPLEVRLLIVPAFRLYVAGSANGEIPVGDILPFSTVTQEVYTWSATRDEVETTPSFSVPHPCIEVDKGIALVGDERNAVAMKIMRAGEVPLIPRGIVKYTVTVKERTDTAQLDMGPLNQLLEIKGSSTAKASLMLKGTVRGEIRIVGDTQEIDRISFGNAFRTDAGSTRKVRILSDKDGIVLKLVPEEFRPTWMTAKLIPDKDIDSKGAWILEVTIPPGKLAGKIGSDAAIIIEMTDGTKRRVRIPVSATAYGDGGKPAF